MSPSPNSKKDASRLRGVGLGVELAAALIGFALLGLWIDQKYGTGPWAISICVVLGCIGGFYNFIRSSMRMMGAPPYSRHGAKKDEHSQN